MSITGGIKFFEKSKCLLDDGATAEVSTGEVVQDFLIDKNPITYWNSVDSNDLTGETIILRFTEAEIDRIILLDHNWKQFTVKYWNGATYVDFTNVVGLDGALGGGISETTFAKDTAYYEVAAVTTIALQIVVTKTQTANEEKSIAQIIATKELGTLTGYPKINNMKHSRNSVQMEMLSGKSKIIKGYESFSCRLKFDNYPAGYSDDLDLMLDLFDLQDPFLMWLCGGRYGSTYFRYELRGFRLKDVYQCQVKGDVPVSYYKNIYKAPIDLEVSIDEHV